MRLSSMLWGGRFNPILPVDDTEHAKQLCELFHVDALYAPADDPACEAFIKENQHVAWPSFIGPFLLKGSDTIGGSPRTTLLDVGFVIDAQARERAREAETGSLLVGVGVCPTWADDDPIADLLLASFGAYPNDEWGQPLNEHFTAAHGKNRRQLEAGEPLPASILRQWSPLALTRHGLWPSRGGLPADGVFVGSSSSFEDVVEFWNLSAADHTLVFYDPAHRDRLHDLMQAYIGVVEESVAALPKDDWHNWLGLWSRDGGTLPDELSASVRVMRHNLGRVIWNGLNEKPPRLATEHTGTVASVTTGKRKPSMTFQVDVPEMFRTKESDRQFVVMTVRAHHTSLEDDGFTFAAPNIPEMNEYYGREMLFNPDYARVEPDGLGIITRIEHVYFNIYALNIAECFQRLFQTFGMTAKPNRPGMIARRLIHQMGGLQSCRVFKIAGVRQLIESFPPHKAFTRGQAMQKINPGFTAYEGLHIESRDKPKLERNDVFLYLVDKRVFRAGLEFKCPKCELDFWVLLDDAAAMMDCEYCGARFNATTQLRDKGGWRYRRSGLFGREDNQEGAIPVTLVLQRLDTSISDVMHPTIFTTALEIQPISAAVPPCEIDFAFLAHDPSGKPELIFGEAKNRKEINAADVSNMKAIAAAFPKWRMDVYPTFAKLADFTRDELQRCLENPDDYPKRHILFSPPDLEPYDLHERFAGLESRLKYSSQIDDLAEATQILYRKQLEGMGEKASD
jgi:hypothetical protein